MGKIRQLNLTKLIVGMIFSSCELVTTVLSRLKKEFGKIDFISQIIPFNATDYYKNEMGANLKRQFISFERLIDPAQLAGIKLLTNSIEQEFSDDNKRSINLDSGYISAAKLVLATTKDYSHRIYIRDGIYAEITLRFKNKTFQKWEWTFPDYQTKEYIEIFNHIRQMYMEQLRCKKD